MRRPLCLIKLLDCIVFSSGYRTVYSNYANSVYQSLLLLVLEQILIFCYFFKTSSWLYCKIFPFPVVSWEQYCNSASSLMQTRPLPHYHSLTPPHVSIIHNCRREKRDHALSLYASAKQLFFFLPVSACRFRYESVSLRQTE